MMKSGEHGQRMCDWGRHRKQEEMRVGFSLLSPQLVWFEMASGVAQGQP